MRFAAQTLACNESQFDDDTGMGPLSQVHGCDLEITGPQPSAELSAFLRQISKTLATFFSRVRKLVRLESRTQ